MPRSEKQCTISPIFASTPGALFPLAGAGVKLVQLTSAYFRRNSHV
jgi:hypothetical protein